MLTSRLEYILEHFSFKENKDVLSNQLDLTLREVLVQKIRFLCSDLFKIDSRLVFQESDFPLQNLSVQCKKLIVDFDSGYLFDVKDTVQMLIFDFQEHPSEDFLRNPFLFGSLQWMEKIGKKMYKDMLCNLMKLKKVPLKFSHKFKSVVESEKSEEKLKV